jgi:hypothetical protein
MARIFDKKASFQWGEVTITLTVDATKAGVRPEMYPAVQKWLNEVAKSLAVNMPDAVPDEDGYFLGKKIAKRVADTKTDGE